ncbi:hypothetical protein ACFUJR_18895 [Streptomyces sp. NPDC057271]
MTYRTETIAAYGDSAASTFDDEPDHGLRSDRTHEAWAPTPRPRCAHG